MSVSKVDLKNSYQETEQKLFAFYEVGLLTHNPTAMPFGNRKFYLKGSFQNITPLEIWNLLMYAFFKA